MKQVKTKTEQSTTSSAVLFFFKSEKVYFLKISRYTKKTDQVISFLELKLLEVSKNEKN